MGSRPRTKLVNTRDFVSIDLATTGLDLGYCDVIEVGAVRFRDGEISERYSELVSLPDGGGLGSYVEGYYGLTPDMLRGKRGISEVIETFIDFIGDDVLVAHNAPFKTKFIEYESKRELLNTVTDTMRIARLVQPDLEHHRYGFLRRHYQKEGIEFPEGRIHRSGNAAESLGIIYNQLRPLLVGRYGEDPETQWFKEWRRRRNEKHSARINKDTIVQTVEEVDETNPFFGMNVCFTGRLDSMDRRSAWQKLVNLGGSIHTGVKRKTDYLVLGNAGFYESVVKDNKSSKMRRAEELQEQGYPIEIISEDFFLEFARDV